MNCMIFSNAHKASEYFEYLFKYMDWYYSAPNEDSFLPSERWLYERFLSLRKGIEKVGTCCGDGYICVTKIGKNKFIYGLNTESEVKYNKCLV